MARIRPEAGRSGGRRIALLLWLGLAVPAAVLSLEARLEPPNIRLDQSVRLILERDRPPVAAPDLEILDRDFVRLGTQHHSRRTQVGGQRRERFLWVLTLQPRRAGILHIPALRWDQEQSEPLTLTVTEAALAAPQPPPSGRSSAASPAPDTGTSAPFRLETALFPEAVRRAQQAVLVVRVFLPRPVTAPRLQDPVLEGIDLLPLGEDWEYLTREATAYTVYQRRYALFPRREGSLEIPALVFEAWLPDNPSRQVRVLSAPQTLLVRPTPEIPAGFSWRPARTLELKEEMPAESTPGEPLARVIEVRAEGIAAADLPELTPIFPEALEVRRDPPGLWNERTPEGVIGIRRERFRVMAPQAGQYLLPAVTLPWWDSAREQWRQARLPERTLRVRAAIPEPEVSSGQTPEPSRETGNRTPAAEFPPAATAPPVAKITSGLGLGFALGLGLAGLLAWFWHLARRRRPGTLPKPAPATVAAFPEEPEHPQSRAIAQVREAYASGQPETARGALLDWAALVLPESPPGNLALLAKRCPEPLRGEILQLEQAFFSPHPLPWERHRVWERLPGFVALPPEEPASFRRKSPIRRPGPSE